MRAHWFLQVMHGTCVALNRSKEDMAKNRGKPPAADLAHPFGSSTHQFLRVGSVDSRAAEIWRVLEATNDYTPVLLNDKLLGISDVLGESPKMMSDRRGRAVRRLQFPVTVERYTHWGQGPVKSVRAVWKVPSTPAAREKMVKQRELAVLRVKLGAPLIHSRQTRARFFEDLRDNVAKVTASQLRRLFVKMTGDERAHEWGNSDDSQSRMHIALDAEEPDVIHMMQERSTDSGTTRSERPHATAFQPFWDAMQEVLAQDVSPHDRRQGDDVMFLASAGLSVRAVVDKARKVLEKKHPGAVHKIPSHEYVRLQFWPKSTLAHRALNYTGRFRVKYRLQTRQLRRTHIDLHYCHKVALNARCFVLRFKPLSLLLGLDDKCKIPVGEPNAEVSGLARQRSTMSSIDFPNAALDHDYHVAAVVPSAMLVTDVPDDSSKAFYRGDLVVCLKDSAFQPSNPFRHMVEMIKGVCQVLVNNAALATAALSSRGSVPRAVPTSGSDTDDDALDQGGVASAGAGATPSAQGATATQVILCRLNYATLLPTDHYYCCPPASLRKCSWPVLLGPAPRLRRRPLPVLGPRRLCRPRRRPLQSACSSTRLFLLVWLALLLQGRCACSSKRCACSLALLHPLSLALLLPAPPVLPARLLLRCPLALVPSFPLPLLRPLALVPSCHLPLRFPLAVLLRPGFDLPVMSSRKCLRTPKCKATRCSTQQSSHRTVPACPIQLDIQSGSRTTL